MAHQDYATMSKQQLRAAINKAEDAAELAVIDQQLMAAGYVEEGPTRMLIAERKGELKDKPKRKRG